MILEIQSKCEHKDVGETTGYVHDFKYGRVCLDCGMHGIQAHWPEHNVLARPLVYKVTYDQYTKLRRTY